MYKEIFEYNARVCAGWATRMADNGEKIILAVSMNSLSQLRLYANKELTAEKIAKQLRAMADSLEKKTAIPYGTDQTIQGP